MPVLTNFYPGVSIGSTAFGKELPILDPLIHTWIFDDFHEYVAANWTVTETDAGATEALTSGHGGLLLITNTAADNDLVSLQHLTTSFAFASGRKAWMFFKFACSEATQVDLFLGLAATDTSPIASDPTDFVAFVKSDGAATISLQTGGSSADIYTSGTVGTLAADTQTTVGMYYDGAQGLTTYLNGAIATTTSAAFASLLPTAALRPTIAIQNGDGNARTLTMDAYLVAMER